MAGINRTGGQAMQAFTYRTFNPSPSDYERSLADALFSIMGKRIFDPSEIAGELNEAGFKPAHGGAWTAELLKTEMRRLGTWANCVGGPVGAHALPGSSTRTPG